MHTTDTPRATQQRTAATAVALAVATQATTGTTTPPGAVPPIGACWEAQGGYFAGLARGANGAPDHLLILSGAKPAGRLDWPSAAAWAGALQADGHSDWQLPTRAESALLFANLKEQFEPAWHWTGDEYDGSCAWGQVFGGNHDFVHKSFEGRARAVRRLVLQSFNHS